MRQETLTPIAPTSATHRLLKPSVPRIASRSLPMATVNAAGTVPPMLSSASTRKNATLKRAQQAPHSIHGFLIGSPLVPTLGLVANQSFVFAFVKHRTVRQLYGESEPEMGLWISFFISFQSGFFFRNFFPPLKLAAPFLSCFSCFTNFLKRF